MLCQNSKIGLNRGWEKGSDTKSAKHPKGRSGFWCLTRMALNRRKWFVLFELAGIDSKGPRLR